jgi:DNA-binding MarR family transcriptional regulator
VYDLIVPTKLLRRKRWAGALGEIQRVGGEEVEQEGEFVTTNQRTTQAKPSSDDPLSLERQVCFALVVASRSVLSIYRPLLEPMGLTHPQYLVMLALWGETPLSVGKIGSLLQLDSPTLSPLLKRLESAGLITRTRSGDDERQVLIDLTQPGNELRERALAIPPAVVAKLGMEIPELEALHAALTRVIAAARGSEPGEA